MLNKMAFCGAVILAVFSIGCAEVAVRPGHVAHAWCETHGGARTYQSVLAITETNDGNGSAQQTRLVKLSVTCNDGYIITFNPDKLK